MNRRTWRVGIAVASAVMTSSCSSINLSALPQPGGAEGGGYDIVIDFDNVLNLPDHAKVVMDGTNVGVVTNMAITGAAVDVTARVGSNVVVPANTHAALQQSAVLGDLYVALERPQPGQVAAPALSPGAHIPLAQTSSPPQLEDTIANLANFVSSGSIQRIQKSIVGINRATPAGKGTARKIASRVAADLEDISDNMNVVDQWFNGVTETADVMKGQLPEIGHMLGKEGVDGFWHFLRAWFYLGTILPSIGSVFNNGYWLGPFLGSLGSALGAFQHSKWSFEKEWRPWWQLFKGSFLPEDKYPAINITSIVGPDGRELSDKVEDVLRIIGAVP